MKNKLLDWLLRHMWGDCWHPTEELVEKFSQRISATVRVHGKRGQEFEIRYVGGQHYEYRRVI